MNRARRPSLQHPLAPVFDRAIDSLGVALSPDTTRHYRGTARNFLSYLGADHRQVQRLDQLRREPHTLGSMSDLHSRQPPLATASYINLLIGLRGICNELAWTEQLPRTRSSDPPRRPSASRKDFHAHSLQNRMNSCRRNFSAATTWVVMPFC